MATIVRRPKITAEFEIQLTEAEARALNEMTKYSAKDFLVFWAGHMSRTLKDDHTSGIISFFDSLRGPLGEQLHQLDKVRKDLGI